MSEQDPFVLQPLTNHLPSQATEQIEIHWTHQ
jgi:hypothetical protein